MSNNPIWGKLQIRSVMLRRISVYKEFKEEVYHENEKHCTKSLARRLAPVTINFPLFKNKNSSFCILVVLLSYHTKRHTNTANCYDYDNIFFET